MRVNVAKKFDGQNEQKINALIKEYVAKIAICSQEYKDVCKEEWGYSHYNFLYKERAIYSLMSAAMHQITPVHQSESSVTRKRDRRIPINRGLEQEGSGRVDLWAYRGGIEYFFEFKRSYVSLNNVLGGDIPAQVHNPWSSLVQQVKEVNAGVNDEENSCYIGIQVITPYESSRSIDTLMERKKMVRRKKEIEKWIGDWFQEFVPNPDVVLWYMNEEEMRIMPTKWDDDEREERWEFHPFHLFFFRILPR